MMDDLEIKISSIIKKQKNSKYLISLPENFYSYVEENIKVMKDEMAKYANEDRKDEYMDIKDKIEKIEKNLKDLKMNRIKIIFSMALDNVFLKINPDTTNLTSQEFEIYERIKEILNDYLMNKKIENVEIKEEKEEKIEKKVKESKSNYSVVRFLVEFPNNEKLNVFEGELIISKEDIVTLPSKLAILLNKKGYAEIVDTIEVEDVQ